MAGISIRSLAKALNNVDTIITPPFTTWLIQHGDEAYPDWVADRIRELLVTQPRDRTQSFSASGAGGCLRAQELQFLGIPGAPIDAQLQNIFNDGKWRHLRWQAELLASGLLVDVEYPLTWGAMRSRGTMDGIGQVPDTHARSRWRGASFGFELKGISTFQFAKAKEAGGLEHHRRQVHRYFLMGGFDLFVMVYEDKTTQAWFEVVVEPDPQLLKESRQELDALNAAIERRRLHDMLPECRKLTGYTWHDCSFGGSAKTCPRAGTWPRIK